MGNRHERPRGRILGDRLEDGQRVAQGLARRGGRDHDHVLAAQDGARSPPSGGCTGARCRAPRRASAIRGSRPGRRSREDRLACRRSPRDGRRRGRATAPRAVARARRRWRRGRTCASTALRWTRPFRTDGRNRRQCSGTVGRRRDSSGVTACGGRAGRRAIRVDMSGCAQLPCATMSRRSAPAPSRAPEPEVADPSAPEDDASASRAAPRAATCPTCRSWASPAAVRATCWASFSPRWVLIVFARQVSDAAAASAQADDLRATNAQAEAPGRRAGARAGAHPPPGVHRPRRARLSPGHGQGDPVHPATDAPALAPDAPGSASVRLGAKPIDRSPLDGWLDVLFGPDPA